jgi:hypothetical protein
MKLTNLFNETKWGWAAKGEAPPPKKAPPTKEESALEQKRRRKEKKKSQIDRAWAEPKDVGDELMAKQEKSNLRKNVRASVSNSSNDFFKDKRRPPPKFFPET